MTEYRSDDINQQTILYKAGEPSSQIVCLTLGEAVVEVNNRWPKDEQNKARFKVAGKGYEYSWSDIKPYLA